MAYESDTDQASKISLLAFKIDTQAEVLALLTAQVKHFEDRLLDPEQGLFSRVRQTGNATSRIVKDSTALKNAFTDITQNATRQDIALGKIEEWIIAHERRVSKLHESVEELVKSIQPLSIDLERRNARKPWVDKIIWLIGALVITTFLTQTGNFILKLVETQNIQELKK